MLIDLASNGKATELAAQLTTVNISTQDKVSSLYIRAIQEYLFNLTN